MKKLLFSFVLGAISFGMTSCLTTSVSGQFQSARIESLGKTVCYTPTLANLSVAPVRVSAELSALEVAGLSLDRAKQTVSAKALNGADIMVAPQFETTYLDGQLQGISVFGYAAKITSFRPLKVIDAPFADTKTKAQNMVDVVPVRNLKTIADLQVGQKVTISLTNQELSGLTEDRAFALAENKLLRQENADLLIEPRYTCDNQGGIIRSFSITAFPATYVNYRSATKSEAVVLNPTAEAEIYYNIVADVEAKNNKIQHTYSYSELHSNNADEMKELARIKVLKEYSADLLLNPQYYFDYDVTGQKVIAITICGTPAIYTNFHPLTSYDAVDYTPVENTDASVQKTSLLQSVLNIFKK